MMRLPIKSWLLAAPLALLGASGCTRDYKFQPVDMWNMSRLKPYEEVNFFTDHSSAQVPPAYTVARGQDRLNIPLYYGTEPDGMLVAKSPLPMTRALVERGQERYNIYCQPCHGLGGYGDGMLVQRGFSRPPSYHIPRLRQAPDGHIFDVITNGYGSMYSYAGRVAPRDRWAIVAYIRVLQQSQHATRADIPAGVNLSKGPVVSPSIDTTEVGLLPSPGVGSVPLEKHEPMGGTTAAEITEPGQEHPPEGGQAVPSAAEIAKEAPAQPARK
jgi:mono/diheme cytochrome c family protein